MIPNLTNADEIRQALQQEPAKPLRVQDGVNQKIYVIFGEQALPTLWDEYFRQEVQHSIEQLDRSEGQPLDIEATIVEARRRQVAREQ